MSLIDLLCDAMGQFVQPKRRNDRTGSPDDMFQCDDSNSSFLKGV